MGILLACEKKEISSSAPGLSMMTLRKCRVDYSFPSHVTRCWVRTAPPPRSMGMDMDRLFKPCSFGLTLRYRKAAAWICD